MNEIELREAIETDSPDYCAEHNGWLDSREDAPRRICTEADPDSDGSDCKFGRV